MALWWRSGFATDVWTNVADDDPVPDKGDVIVSLARWLKEREALNARPAPVGVRVDAAKNAPSLIPDIVDRPLIALAFAKFADGRAFSYARLLRERYKFGGELRATGDVLIDEIPLMLRCGFDSFEVANPATLRRLEQGVLPGPTLYYQPSAASEAAAAANRPWLRKKILEEV
jgi:uncharacterized protein (DUF934 family)